MGKGRSLGDLEWISARLVQGIGIFIFCLLCISSLIFTRDFPIGLEIPCNKIAVFPLTLLGAAVLCAGILWLAGKVTEDPGTAKRRLRILLCVDLAWIILSGIAWVLLCRSDPVADQAMVLTSAQRFSEGNYGRLEYAKYLFMHPHQLGLTAYEEQIFRVFGRETLIAVLLFNVPGLAVAVFSGYKITEYLFQEEKILACYLLLSGICFPFFMYSAYFYGEVWSIALSLFSVWHLLRYLKKGKKSSFVFALLGGCAAVLLRNNSVIVLIACSCVLVIKGLANRRWQYLLCVALLFVGTSMSRQALEHVYERRCGHELNDGIPMVLYIAMGMQESDKDAGWYNGYNVYIYQDVCKYNGPTAAELGKAEIRARAKEFLFHPGYALDFYWRKFTSQWNDPTYGCFIMTYATERERGAFANSVYEGKMNQALKAFMDSYQILIYGTVLLLLLGSWKRKAPLETNILLIVVIGGVLFHILWEAKSRYVLPYFVAMLPMAAAGLEQAYQLLKMRRKGNEVAESGR